MTTEDLTALQALRAKMTPGEWQWRYDALGTDYPQWSIQPGILIADGTDGTPGGDMIDKANAAGIVALVNASDALIAEVLALRAEVERLRGIATDMVRHVDWLTHGLPDLLERGGLTDEEGIIAEAIDAANSARAALGAA